MLEYCSFWPGSVPDYLAVGSWWGRLARGRLISRLARLEGGGG